MARRTQMHPNLTPIPMLPHETIYIGVDIGKFRHVAGFVSKTLLQRHERFEGCPTFTFEQTRAGFRAFADRIREFTPLEQATVLLEHTGHYHRLLEQYLLELDITVYRIHVQKRPKGMMKTDKRDALGLANTLYTQLALGAQVADKMQLVRHALPPTKAAAQLRGLVQHRYELSQERTQRRNKLTAICDEIFPEFTRIFHDPNRESALAIREQFPTPHAIATASLAELRALRKGYYPSEAKLVELQQLARETIGTKDIDRQHSLVFAQKQLIKELRVIEENLEQLHEEIGSIVAHSREGQILQSIPPVGPIQAATIIASIGNIGNFEKASEFKSYCGWAPQWDQTGVSLDWMSLSKRGARPLKHALYLMAARASALDCEWARIYRRLLPRLCTYDERTKEFHGKKKVLGRIAGQMASMFTEVFPSAPYSTFDTACEEL
jgi:transposase